MKVDNALHPVNAGRVEPGNTKAKVARTDASQSQPPASASATELRQPAADSSHDIDAARVAELKQAIAEGRLQIDPGKIAQGLIASLQDMYSSQS